MLALLFLTGGVLLGACLTRRVLRGTLEVWEQALWGTVAGWMLAALGAYAAARVAMMVHIVSRRGRIIARTATGSGKP